MGSTSHLTPLRFAEELRTYLWAQIEDEADASGRWLESKTEGARSREYWRKITSGIQAMTTNDIEVLGALFDQSPYEFIRAARQWSEPANVTPLPRRDVPAPVQTRRAVAKKKSRDPGGDEGDF